MFECFFLIWNKYGQHTLIFKYADIHKAFHKCWWLLLFLLRKYLQHRESTGRANPWKTICYLYEHLSGFLTTAIKCIDLPWVLLCGFMIYKNKQWLEQKWPLFFFSIFSTRTEVTTRGSNTPATHKAFFSLHFYGIFPFIKNQYE